MRPPRQTILANNNNKKIRWARFYFFYKENFICFIWNSFYFRMKTREKKKFIRFVEHWIWMLKNKLCISTHMVHTQPLHSRKMKYNFLMVICCKMFINREWKKKMKEKEKRNQNIEKEQMILYLNQICCLSIFWCVSNGYFLFLLVKWSSVSSIKTHKF